VKQEKVVGIRITARGGPERSSHVAGDLCELRRGGNRAGLGNAASPELSCGNGVDDEVDDVMVELWTEQLGLGHGGVGGEAPRNASELAEDDGVGK